MNVRSLLLAAAFAAVAGARAQSIRWDPPGGALSVGQTSPLELVCQDCDPTGVPRPPAVPGLRLEGAGRTTELAFSGSTYVHTTKYTYAALLLDSRPVDIPAFTVETDKGPVRVPAVHFVPTAATVGSGGRSLASVAHSTLEPSASAVWAGQVFDLDYRLEADGGYYPDVGRGLFDWNAEPLVTEDWAGPKPYHRQDGDTTWVGFDYQTRAMAPRPGTYTLAQARQILHLAVGVFGFFQQRQYDQFSVTSNAPVLDVRALPAPPAGFDGAVGQFILASRIVPDRAAVGEPVTWTLTLRGTGNWPEIRSLPARSVSRTFQVVRPRTKLTPAQGKIFDATMSEDAVLIPTRAGRYTLPGVRFVYFDPASATYRETATAPFDLSVVAGAGAQTGTAGPMPAGGGLLLAPAMPSGMPGEPLAEGPLAARPLPVGAAVAAIAPAFALALGLWAWFAYRQARATDPARAQREARRRLEVALDRLAGGADGAVRGELLEWQRQTARVWGMREAAPRPESFDDPAWARLWTESEDALYGPAGALPADWIDRARSSLASRPTPPFAPRQMLLRRNLLPFLGLAVLIAAIAPSGRAADPATEAYRQGRFAAAAAAWRMAPPNDPAARYDVSLALGQENQWSEAVAEAAAAFVQRPQDAAIRRQFALACDKAGIEPGPLAPFLSPGAGHRVAEWASPAQWRQRLVLCGWIAAAGCVLLLVGAYAAPGRRLLWAGSGAVLLAVALAAGAVSEWAASAYGVAADADAAMVWRSGTLRSIPTEADTSQETSSVGTGLVGIEDRSFLGWVRLTFPNGESGWLRRDDVVPLW